MAGTPKIRAKRMTELSELADRIWLTLEAMTPERVFQENPDPLDEVWADAHFGAMELNANLLTLRDVLRKKARLPKLPDPIHERAEEAKAELDQLKKSQAGLASTG